MWPAGKQQQFDNVICDSYNAAIKAAADGLGVALGIFPTLNNWVNNKQLILPFTEQIATDKGFWLVYPKNTAKHDVAKVDDEISVELLALFHWIKKIFDDIPALNLNV